MKHKECPTNSKDQSFLRRKTMPQMVSSGTAIKVADLFCGCGGLSLGVREAARFVGKRFVSVLAADLDATCLATYEDNFTPLNSLLGDIRSVINGRAGVRATESEAALIEKVGKIDVLIAGPPCQGHSDLNNHTRRKDERNALYERVGRFAELFNPSFILIENVPNVVYATGNPVALTVKILAQSGYSVADGVVDLAQLGVPQQRRRHVLVAAKKRKFLIDQIVEKYKVQTIRSVAWAIKDIEATRNGSLLDSASCHTLENRKRIAHLFQHNLYDLPNHLRPVCHRTKSHSYVSMYGRMSYTKPAQTITSGFVSPGQGRFIHPVRRRTLTPHEAARLQFFPDFFDFSKASTRTSLAGMIGNAVPMKLSFVFTLEYLNDKA